MQNLPPVHNRGAVNYSGLSSVDSLFSSVELFNAVL